MAVPDAAIGEVVPGSTGTGRAVTVVGVIVLMGGWREDSIGSGDVGSDGGDGGDNVGAMAGLLLMM